MIRSVSYNQTDIPKSIMHLCGIDRFCADVTYGNGKFYEDIPEPTFKYDIDPLVEGVIECSSSELPLGDSQISSLVFDPPFLTYVRAARKGNGDMIMANRFGGYWRYDELVAHYRGTIREAYRVLRKKGILVFKCQDIIHNHKMHCTHANILMWSDGMFRLRDLFVLPAKHRMPIPQQSGTKKKIQRHARIFHSYFMVLEKL
jgi:hypothetical protein